MKRRLVAAWLVSTSVQARNSVLPPPPPPLARGASAQQQLPPPPPPRADKDSLRINAAEKETVEDGPTESRDSVDKTHVQTPPPPPPPPKKADDESSTQTARLPPPPPPRSSERRWVPLEHDKEVPPTKNNSHLPPPPPPKQVPIVEQNASAGTTAENEPLVKHSSWRASDAAEKKVELEPPQRPPTGSVEAEPVGEQPPRPYEPRSAETLPPPPLDRGPRPVVITDGARRTESGDAVLRPLTRQQVEYEYHRRQQQYQQQRRLQLQQQPPLGPARPREPSLRPGQPQRQAPGRLGPLQPYQAGLGPGPQPAYRPRPLNYRPPPSTNKPPPAWKRVWSKIEQGLDGLADMEDAVTDRASQLYSTTLSTVKIPTWKAKDEAANVPPNDLKARSDHMASPPAAKAATPVEATFELSRFQKKVASKQTAKPATAAANKASESKMEPFNLYGVIYQKSVARTDESQPDKTASARKVDWRTAILNGGASVPLDEKRVVASGPRDSSREANPMAQQRPPPPTAGAGPPPGRPVGTPGAATAWTPPPSRPGSATPPPRRTYPDEDEEESWTARVARIMPPIPRIPRLSFGRGSLRDPYSTATLDAWSADDEEVTGSRGLLGIFGRRKPSTELPPTHPVVVVKEESTLTPTMNELMERCQNGKSTRLLTAQDERECRAIGRRRAMLDIVKLLSSLVAVRQLPLLDVGVPHSVSELMSTFLPSLSSAVAASVDTWAPFALAAAFLASESDLLIRRSRLESFSSTVEQSVREDAQYGSLFLRLFSSTSMGKAAPAQAQRAARKQVREKVEIARLRFFVWTLLAMMVAMTVSVLRPLVVASLQTVAGIVLQKPLRTWPPQWGAVMAGTRNALASLSETVAQSVAQELSFISNNPMKVAYEASIFVVLASAALLPTLEAKRKVQPVSLGDTEDEEAELSHARFTEQLADLGGSSALRLDFLAEGRAIESLLERWKSSLPPESSTSRRYFASSVARILVYNLISGGLLFAPLLGFGYAGIATFGSDGSPHLRWDSLADVGVVLLAAFGIVREAIRATVSSKESEGLVAGFLTTLAGAIEERKQASGLQAVDLRLQASISPTTGVLVKDLWAAHTTKRAWAVRGANLYCRNGEIVMLLGDEGAGKSRLLTTLSEAITSPPRGALSATRVRGAISFGGLEVSKWDKVQLTKRCGILLNDVRTLSDTSKVLSSLSLEEILEPTSGTCGLGPSGGMNPSARSAMILALKISGLYSSLLPRLPSKLSTIVTANEEDLRPSGLRPRFTLLSPVEWSKLMVARVLAQAIYDNENSAGNNDNVENCLVGSMLLLDDAFAHFSEVDEAKLLQDLRRSGAAVIVTSNRWATGRFADRVAVMKGGAIVESGAHNELLNRGPQQSIYAAKWHTMTTQ